MKCMTVCRISVDTLLSSCSIHSFSLSSAAKYLFTLVISHHSPLTHPSVATVYTKLPIWIKCWKWGRGREGRYFNGGIQSNWSIYCEENISANSWRNIVTHKSLVYGPVWKQLTCDMEILLLTQTWIIQKSWDNSDTHDIIADHIDNILHDTVAATSMIAQSTRFFRNS